MATFMALIDGAATPWRADPAALTLAIQAVWAEVEVNASDRSEACSLRWTAETEEGPAEAYLHQDGTCLYLDASLTHAARLACAFRRLIPQDVEPGFCDQGYNFDIRIRPGTDDAELIKEMNADGE
ncbi:hypothetical protein ACWCQQ_25505 [Streptomyces sp. NPDC002143]